MRNNSPTHRGKRCLPLAIAVIASLGATAYGQYLPANVVQPGDPIFASSANSPGSEGVANAIDGTTAKYLNFDQRNGTNTSGFVVMPSVGVTWVTGIAIESANDAPERDPLEFTLEGSNDAVLTNGYTDGTWTMIVDMTIPLFTNRYEFQSFYFTNYAAYRNYRWTVLKTAQTNTCCMQVAEVQLLGTSLPKNVVQPGDQIFASSANSPGSEGVANAIDGTTAKYLNFDQRNGTNTSGFAVTPSVGSTLINGIGIESANDAPERDPLTFTVEGSNDDVITNGYTDGTWTLIAQVSNIPLFVNRYEFQYFLFPNSTPYKHYRWTVLATAQTNTCCMQVAEVQFLGAGAPQNVVVPSDQIFASSANSPGSEGVANAIDGTTAKYLNFDQRNGTNTSGFVVTPSVGATVIVGLGIESANDAPERDPLVVTVEGANDATITNGYTDGTWSLITTLNVPIFTNRYEFQYLYFPNQLPYKHYRWTVLQTAQTNTCCMQVAEVQFLAVTAKADCSKAAIVAPPIDTPVLSGYSADLFVDVNGPWPLQWFKNNVAIPGASKSKYTTDIITSANATNLYTVAIVGCQTSAPVHTVLFTPSTVTSVGIQFAGGGANGTPESMNTNDIAGVQQQAYWNSVSGSSGTVTADVLTDSNNTNYNQITFDYTTSGTWGAGVSTDTPTGRMLNGLAGVSGNPAPVGSDQVLIFHNVPSGSHAVLIYSISPPLQFEEVKFAITNQNLVAYQRTLAAGEYNDAPGFYRATSTDPAKPDIGDFVRFDGVHPDSAGNVTVTFNVLSAADRQTGVNAIQLLLNAPNPGNPPVITQQPQPAFSQSNGVVTISVTATGNGLTYQWRKNGFNINNGGNISGATSATLTISPFTPADQGIYSVAIFNQAGSAISGNASALISNYNIKDQLAVYYTFNETSGTTASNSASGGLPATLLQGNLTWGAGKVAGAAVFPGDTSMFVSNFTKASTAMAGSAWVNIPSASAQADMVIYRNQEGDFQFGGVAGRILGQFELIVTRDPVTGNMYPSAVVSLGNNYARATGSTPFPFDAWHNVAFSADGAQLRLYIDSTNVASVDYVGTINPPATPWISIGSRVATQTDPTMIPPLYILDPTAPDLLTGSVDELALWDRALSANEILGIYQAGSTNAPLTSVQESPPSIVTPATLTATLSGGNLTIKWTPAGGRLLSSPTLGTGATWTSLGTANPAVVPATGKEQFFRVANP